MKRRDATLRAKKSAFEHENESKRNDFRSELRMFGWRFDEKLLICILFRNFIIYQFSSFARFFGSARNERDIIPFHSILIFVLR